MIKYFTIFLLIIILHTTSGCSIAGWAGYYQMKKPAKYSKTMDFNIPNSAIIDDYDFGVSMPKGCSGFFVGGIITPITPPIPVLNFRNISLFDNPCNNFTIHTRIVDAEISLKTNNIIYKPNKNHKASNKFKYTFPIKAKNIDSGSIIIEKDGEKVELPFEYKYYKFWH